MLKAFLVLLLASVVIAGYHHHFFHPPVDYYDWDSHEEDYCCDWKKENSNKEIGENRANNVPRPQGCQLNGDGQAGVCVKFLQCPQAQTDFNTKGIRPVICQNYPSNPNDPVVCCPTPPVSAAVPQVSQIQTIQQQAALRGRRISEEKCENYYFPPPLPPGEVQIVVVGGTLADPEEFRYMAAIGWRIGTGSEFDYLCGGSLIAPEFVLTAAHCTSLSGVSPEVVRPGGNQLNQGTDIPISNIYIHPDYRRRQFYNDIALLKLSRNASELPACLWTQPDITIPVATAIGYGRVEFEGQRSNSLLRVDLRIFSNEDCRNFYGTGFRLENGILDSQVCIGDTTKVRDTCQGDSGGPVVVRNNTRGRDIPFIIGVTSFGQGCAGGTPSIYTRVSSYLDWIEGLVWPSG